MDTCADINLYLGNVTRNSVATYYDINGILQTAAANVTRYNYNPSTAPATFTGVLAENSSTNQLTNSRNLSSYSGSVGSGVFTANYAISPDGTTNAATFIPSVTVTDHYFGAPANPTITAGENFSISIFVKRIGTGLNRYFWRAVRDGGFASFVGVVVDLQNLVVGVVAQGTHATVGNVQIIKLPNGWVRIIANNCVLDNTTTSLTMEGGYCSNMGVPGSSIPTVNVAGDATNGFGLYGDQFEVGATATSYIPTTSTAITRAQDVLSGTTYESHTIIMVGGKYKQTRGLEINETDLTCYDFGAQFGTPTLVGSIPFIQAVRLGLFDRAKITRSRIFFPNNANGMPQWGDMSLGAVPLFIGEITDTDVTSNVATIKCKDATNLLNIFMPRRQYQPTCPFTFGDSNCTFNRSSLTVSSTVGAGSAVTTINCNLAQATGYFNYGIVTWTSGLNAGISRSVKNYTPGVVVLTGPPPLPLAVGDNFTITPGCSKNLNASDQTFNASLVAGSTSTTIITALNMAAGFFNNGTVQFTSGQNVGQVRTISNWANGTATVSSPFPFGGTVGDKLLFTTAPTNTGNTCTGFNNTVNYGGQNYVPVPETAY